MTASFCFKCGSAMPESAAFCPVCGTAAAKTEAPGSPTPAQPTPVEPALPNAAPPATTPRPGPLSTPSKKSNTPLYAALTAIIALLLIGGVLVFSCDSNPATAPGEVLLEPADSPGAAPFTASVDTNTAPSPSQPPSASSPIPVSSNPANPVAPPALGIRSVQGSAPGLYGGTQNVGACDAEQLIRFLQENPQKAAAWAAVQGIAPTEIPRFVRSLTPVVLRADTRVTNHGYFNGRATPIQSILEAGTAVLVDDLGQPRVKCNCGNPLAPPVAQTQAVTYSGKPWPGFRPSRVINIINTTMVRVSNFVLVNLVNPGYFTRPPGIPATGVPADGEILTDSFCDMYPELCLPETPGFSGEPTLGTGDVQVTLRWGSTADLDLAVTDPTGATIYYKKPASPSGGKLDVDAHGDCKQLSHAPVENIFWPPGQAPDGVYTITVTYFSECPGGVGPQNYDLTVLMNGAPADIQPMVAHIGDGGRTEESYTVIPNAGSGQPIITMGTTGNLPPGGKDQFEAEKKATPQPPANNPPANNPPAEPEMTPEEAYAALVKSCEEKYPPAVFGAEASQNPWFTLCIHDPTTNDVSDSSSNPLDLNEMVSQ